MGPRASLDECGKSRLSPQGFDPRTVQPVASRYTGTDRYYEKSSRRIADTEYQFDFRRQDSDAKHTNWQQDPPKPVKCYTDHSFSRAGYTHTNTWHYKQLAGTRSNELRSGAFRKGRFTHTACCAHAVPLPCRAVNSHMPCRAPAMLRQCRVLRESSRGSRKYPNC